MPTPATPSAPTPAGDDRNLVRVDENDVAPSFEERLRLFWQRNSTAVTAVLIAALAAIAGKGGWEYLQAEQEKETGRAYAAASTPAQLKTFAETNPKHTLAGVAQLRMADTAYSEGNYTDAAALYERAVETLTTPVLSSRARLGAAMSKLQGGRVAEGEAALKALSSDPTAVKVFRAEATYHLASHALSGGRFEEVKTHTELLMQIDPASPWAQRSTRLRAAATAPESAPAPAAAPDAPAVTVPGLGK